MDLRKQLLLWLSVTLAFSMRAQETLPEFTKQDSVASSYWLLGLGVNAVDDSGQTLSYFPDFGNHLNMVPYPSRISAGRYFKSGLGLELIGSYNRYKEGNLIDGVIITEDIPYWAIDTRLSYDLNKLVGHTGFFDPYLGAGIGYTDANNVGRGTYNAVVGFRIWLSDDWGLDLNSSGKWSFGDEASNHMQHAAGVVYRFDTEYELTRKGREKAQLRQELEEAMQRRQDSLMAARAEEERQQRLAEAAEAERLAALEREEAARKAAEQSRKDSLKAELSSMGRVQYAFDSSYLSKESKEVLRQVAAFMQANPTLKIGIHAHADSRGPAPYNQWLSERRAERARDYLISQGTDASRLTATGHGETQLLNDCADGVRCSSAQHAENRRCDLEITVFE
ncbi:OmpA family protein [Robiginitalea sediminis]|uniref:OmpA family protein n=1 Tax=Robiginitalea sediminis TaxID=1982593 RepID=UPI001E584B66|nr:OmpA family protein [Robiginitalea sediminis]